MAQLTPFGQSLQAQGGASALLRLQGYTPGTRDYKRAYDTLYNLQTGRQKSTKKYANIVEGVEQRAERQAAGRAIFAREVREYRPSRLAISGEIRPSNDWEPRSRVSVRMPVGFDIPFFESLNDHDQHAYVTRQFSGQFYLETGLSLEPGFDANLEENDKERGVIVDDFWFE